MVEEKMIKDVSFEKTTYAEPYKFEAENPNIGGIALGTAVDYMEWFDIDNG
jgi:selenocysteine lyase/cysteine desulfurase